MDKNTQDTLRLLAELQRLTEAAPGDNTARLTVRSENGEYLGDILLTPRATSALADAVGTVADYAEAMPDDFAAGYQSPRHPEDIDPLLEQDFAYHCIGLNVDDLMATAARDPERAVAEFDEITASGEL
ncbi:hypothetical protein ACFVG1_13240 [Streptomyces bacillaris]|uniref:hypothetical protein n=1 Tax=Streptomyces bacillaris TaxID=68179 RepID=UPI0035E39952